MLDRKPPRKHDGTHHRLAEFLDAFGLIDVWRMCFPQERQYTFHSSVHDSISSIDYILTLASGLDRVLEITHLPRGISDHSLVKIQYISHLMGRRRIFPIYPGFF